jgi:hypothetical protein
MKKTLRESLVDYDLAMLRAMAEVRGAAVTSNHRLTAAEELAAQLVTPASLAIALADLSPAEREALATLQAAGGWMEVPRFARRFGNVRVMGPGRLERERPWQSPASPAEGLWYRALIFKGFRQTEAGVVEVVYLPEDGLAALPDLLPGGHPLAQDKPEPTLEPSAPPAHVQPTNAHVVEDVFAVLAAVRNYGVRLEPDGSLHPKDLQTINAMCVSPLPPAAAAGDERLALVIHLARAAGLTRLGQGRLALDPDPARAWLQAPPAQRLLALQIAWRDDPAWNDLWRVPSLKPQPTGWKNDPALARRQVLGFLTACHPGKWYGLEDLVRAVKAAAPDFQRPDGDYTAWYIHDLHGRALMGFEHWERVEGALLRYLVAGPLHWLGVVDLGFAEDFSQPTAFRLAETGLPLLGLAPPAAVDEPPVGGQGVEPVLLSIGDDFSLSLPLEASLYTRFQVARLADFLGREAGQVRYRLSRLSLARAQRQGITPEQVGAFLARASGGQVPDKVMAGLRGWQKHTASLRLEEGAVLRADRPETLQALRRDPTIAPLLGEILGPLAILVPREHLGQVRRWLAERGYLE